uniref:Mucin 6, oligomeric mucus/gel-forming n=1 Tax=Loxodonta africana TaxID=9785 RepID=G3TMX8_LOXAF
NTLSTDEQRGWCSTWGAGHFSTFDHHVYNFSGTCNYVFAAICKDPSPTFSVQLRRGSDGTTARIIMELGSSVVTVQSGVVSVKDVGVVSLPYTSNGLQITPFGQNVRLVAKQLELELEVLWGPDGYVMVRTAGVLSGGGGRGPMWGRCQHCRCPQVLVERKFMGKMCGLCCPANQGVQGSAAQPTSDPVPTKAQLPRLLHLWLLLPRRVRASAARSLGLHSPNPQMNQEEGTAGNPTSSSPCPAMRACGCVHGQKRRWGLSAPSVQSGHRHLLGSATHQGVVSWVWASWGRVPLRCPWQLRMQHAAPGSPSPAGMVLDDLSKNQTCVPITQCPCMFNGAVYAPGEVTSSSCRTCQCSEGLWKCTEQPCPGRCSLEGGSFVTTFDARPYRFHGTCTYILLQSHQLPEEGSLMAVYDKSGYSHSETSLVAIIYLSGQDKIMISQDEVITNNREVKWLPYKIGNITIFRQTSTHLQMATDFGLELMIQLQPVFQAYVTVEPQFRGQTRAHPGLCGNYNGDTTDDFMTSMGITEGTASLFVDSWRAGNCPTALERETDPCSMSQLNKVCAETHCSVLVKKGSVFEKCHSVVNPQPFYKRCVYQACNYEETFPHICAALGAYAHLCASHGVLLWDWRSSVDNCTIPCTGNTTFSYNSEACNRTCMSLSDHTLECHPSAVPVDGCNCPEGTYLNHKAECVRKGPVSLPSWDSHEFIFGRDSPPLSTAPPCYCINGRLTCSRKAQTLLATCTAPKTFQSCSQSSESKFGAACAPTCQMLATGIACVPTKCEPGCVCAEGLYEDANGQCVPPSNCSCEFGGASYPTGAELNTDCQTCTCKQGKWVCQQSTSCASTCTLYGEGHMITFDGQRFVFDGNCEYTLTTDGCSTNDSQPTFKIVTENVICGKSGVTCSRAIKLFLGALSIVLADKTYTVSGHDPQVSFQVQPGSMHLVLEVYIAGKYNLTLTWNKHMMVLIKVSRTSAQVTPVRAGGLDGNPKADSGSRMGLTGWWTLVSKGKRSPPVADSGNGLVAKVCMAHRVLGAGPAHTRLSNLDAHPQVYHMPYYEACVRDTCGCDTGGDCECLCDAVAAYAKACLDKGVCVDWRSPDFCRECLGVDGIKRHQAVPSLPPQGPHPSHPRQASCPASAEVSFPCSPAYHASTTHHSDDANLVPTAWPSTEAQPTTPATPTPRTSGLLSSARPSTSPGATPVGPTATASLPATSMASPQAPSSAQTDTVPTAPTKPAVSPGESPRSTTAITPRVTSAPTPTSTRRVTATRPTVTQATSHPTASHPTTATQTTAESHRAHHSSYGTPTALEETSSILPATHQRRRAVPHHSRRSVPGAQRRTGPPGDAQAWPRPRHSPTNKLPPCLHPTATGHGPHTSAVPASHGEYSVGSSSIVSCASAEELDTGRASGGLRLETHELKIKGVENMGGFGCKFRKQSTKEIREGDPKAVETKQTRVHTTKTTGTERGILANSEERTNRSDLGSGGPRRRQTRVTPLLSPTAASTSTAATGTTTGRQTRTRSPEITPPTRIPPLATSSVTPTSHRVTTPAAEATTSSPSSPPPTGTSLSTTTGTKTKLPTPVPPDATSSVTPTSQQVTTLTPAAIKSSSSPLTTATSRHTTAAPSTGTRVRATGTPVPETTLPVSHSQPHTTFTTLSQPTVSASSSSRSTGPPTGTSFKTTTTLPIPSSPKTTLPTPAPPVATSSVTPTSQQVTTLTPAAIKSSSSPLTTATSRPTTAAPSTGTQATGTPVPETTSPVSHSRPHTNFTTPSQPTVSASSSSRSTGPPTGTSFKTTTTLPTPSSPETTLPTPVQPLATSSVTATSHPVTTPTTETISSSPSSSPHTGTSRTTTAAPSTGTRSATGTPVPETTSPVSHSQPHTTSTTLSQPTVSASSSSRSTGPNGTSFKTTTTLPTPSSTKTKLPTSVPPVATSSVTPTSHQVTTPTRSSSSPLTTATSRPTTAAPSTGTRSTPSTSPFTKTTSATGSSHTSVSTVKTTISQVSFAPSTAPASSTSPPHTTITPKPTSRATGTLVPETSLSATHSQPHTSFITLSPPTLSPSSSSHSTRPPLGTSFKTTTSFPIPSGPRTTVSTRFPPFATSSVTLTSHRVTTLTAEAITSSPSSAWPTGTSRPTTAAPSTGPRPTASTSPLTKTTSATGPPHSSLSTAKTSPHVSHSSSLLPPLPTISHPSSSFTSLPSVSQIPFTTSVSLPHLPFSSTHFPSTSSIPSVSTLATSTSSFSSGIPASFSSSTIASVSTYPSQSAVPTTQHSKQPSSAYHTPSSPGQVVVSNSTSSFTHSPHSTTSLSSSVSPPFTSSPHSSTLPPTSTLHLSSPTSSVPVSSSAIGPSTSSTTPSAVPSSPLSSQSTSLSTPLTSLTATPGIVSSTLGATASPSSPATMLTTNQTSTTGLLTTLVLTSSITAHGSSSIPVPESFSTQGSSISSVVTSLSSPTGICSVREYEKEITYLGCTANVTMTRCEGSCASSASFNIHTKQVDIQCGCCHPLRSYEKQLVLPCPDPSAPGDQLVLTVLVFSSCACSSQACRD